MPGIQSAEQSEENSTAIEAFEQHPFKLFSHFTAPLDFPIMPKQEETALAKQERLYTSKEGAFMTRLTINSFRVKVSKLGIKGQKQGAKVFYSRKQLEDIHNGIAAKKTRSGKLLRNEKGNDAAPKTLYAHARLKALSPLQGARRQK